MLTHNQFWFDILEQALAVTTRLVGSRSDGIQLADWNLLVRLPLSRTLDEVQQLFYPHALANISPATPRRAKFLSQLDAACYFRLYQTLLQTPELSFAPVQKILLAARTQGKVVSMLLHHVTSWLNPPNGREKEKLPLWEGLLPDPSTAQHLESRIFDLVRPRIDELSSNSNDALLALLPANLDESYLERFQISIWRDLLLEVRSVAGPNFHGVLDRFNTEDPADFDAQPDASFVNSISVALSHLPSIALNPALNRAHNLQSLMSEISPIITRWAIAECTNAINAQDAGCSPRWPSSVRRLVASQQQELVRTTSREPISSPSQTKSPSDPGIVEDKGTEIVLGVTETAVDEGTAEYPEEPAMGILTQQTVSKELQGSLMEENKQDCESAPGQEVGQMTSPMNGLAFWDRLPNIAQSKKRHRQKHGSHASTEHSLLPASRILNHPGSSEIRQSAPSQARPIHPKKKFPSWLHAPAT